MGNDALSARRVDASLRDAQGSLRQCEPRPVKSRREFNPLAYELLNTIDCSPKLLMSEDLDWGRLPEDRVDYSTWKNERNREKAARTRKR